MNKLVIFYFSGTGNARNVSRWIEEVFAKSNVPTKMVDISKLRSRKTENSLKDSIIGFCSPTHGFNFPPIMLHFLFRFPKSRNNKAFVINTRAGMKMGKLFLPGISGITHIISSVVLKSKGYKIAGLKAVDLPSNWISLHPGIKTKVVNSIYKKRKKESEKFAIKLLANKKVLVGMYPLPIDLLLLPVALVYYLVGRFILAKTFYASMDCNRCSLCLKKCPVQAIRLVDKRPFWTYKCESCMQCMNICPERAIETAHGTSVGIYYLISSLLIVKTYKLLGLADYFNAIQPEWLKKLAQFVIDSSLLLLLFVLAYWLFHHLLRFRLFERFVFYTSLTHFRFWRRYKSPK